MTATSIKRLIKLKKIGGELNIDDFNIRFEPGPFSVVNAHPIVLEYLARPKVSEQLSTTLSTLERIRSGNSDDFDYGTPGESLPDDLRTWIYGVEGELGDFEFEEEPSKTHMPNQPYAVPSLTLEISYGNSAFRSGILVERRPRDTLYAAEVLAAIILAKTPYKVDKSCNEFLVHILIIDDKNARVLRATLPRSWVRFMTGKTTGSGVPKAIFTMSDPISLLDLCDKRFMASLITTMLCEWGPGAKKDPLESP